CGSGSFLIGAYQYLLDHCLKWHIEHTPENHKKAVYKDTRNGQWRLTIEEKKRLLTTHIFGVDIDPQAVEVSKLSLLLKVLEGETDQSLRMGLLPFSDRALPNLADNVRCGNSLIGPDYFTGRLINHADDMTRVNPFDWKRAFPDAMKDGGFDCVIGNPPYVRSINLKEQAQWLWEIYRSLYRAASAREWDTYLIFVEKGLELLNPHGTLGFILPNKFVNSGVGENLRAIIARGRYLDKLLHFGAFQVFPQVTTYTCLLFLNAAGTSFAKLARYVGPVNQKDAPCPLPEETPGLWITSEVPSAELTPAPWVIAGSTGDLLIKLRQQPALGSIADVFQGTGTRADRVYLLEERGSKGALLRVYSYEKDTEFPLERTFLKRVLRGRSIGRYEPKKEPKLLLIVPYEVINGKSILVPEKNLAQIAPRTLAYLRDCKARLDEREKGRFKGAGWYCYGRPQNMDRFEVAQKIVLPDVVSRGSCLLDRQAAWLIDTAYAITLKPTTCFDLRFLLAVLNSPMLTYFLMETGTTLRGGYFRMKTAYLNPFPVPNVDMSRPSEKHHHDRIVDLAESMLALHKHLASASSAAQKTVIQRQIDATDAEIDRLVYELYDLTDEEIAIVESSTNRKTGQ
ncbi:MAG TPA: Eco57I restriction-modification methylase domain-containing protein, partial [Armatimonadota bacterium]|nr:Eco57I restriction-modification methylase domain-containing protein [Armatimonadota bacterium]